jgi:hypothetical protein
VKGASWQSRTAVALLIGAAGEGVAVLLSESVAGAFVLATFAISVGLGFAFGPWIGGAGAGIPPLGLLLVESNDDTFIQRLLAVVAVVLLLGGSAWMTGRVRERYGHPPWLSEEGVSE